MKNFSEQEVRSDMLANYGCSVPVYFKILKCRKDFDRFPYFYISGKEYILWIYANPRHPEDTTNVAIPGVEGFKEIPKEIFGDFTKAKDAVIYALYKEDVIPQDYSGFKRVFCRNKADYRVVRDFGRGVTLIPAERLSKKRMAYSFPQFFGLLNVGLILTAVALVLFKTPNHLAFGGTTGFAILFNAAIPALPVSVYMWIMNAVLVLLGLIFLDRKAVLWSAFASFALSGYTSLFEWLFPVTSSITGDLWLDVCFAVLLPAVGSAIVFDIGASTGGTDILAMILRKRTDIEIGKALFAVDVAVVVAAIGIFGARVGLYCVLALIGKTFVVDGFIESIRQRKVCQVICDHPRDVEEFIVKKLGRTATLQFGWGAYSGKRVVILTSVLSRREAMKLRLFVRATDPGAFITITSSSEIIGRGFRGVN